MKISVLFPKPQCYELKDLGLQRTYKERFMKYLKMLSDCGCNVEILLEDTLANNMTFDASITPYRVVSCIAPSDIGLIKQYPDIEELNHYVFDSYPSVEHVIYDAEKKFIVPLSVMKEGKAAYYTKRVKSYHKRYAYALGKYIEDCTNIMQFRLGNTLDRGLSACTTARQGDGRLCIEVSMTQGVVTSYYGGVFVTEDTLPMILSL